jgi:putative membrane protein
MTVGALAALYPWTKALHLISVFAWMAGLFYLPRLYVYHSAAAPGSETSEVFKGMERRLLRAIMNPAMIAAWIFGITLVLTPGVVDWRAGWWHGKAVGFLAMTGFHMHLAAARKDFAADGRRRTERYWRIANEAPTLLLVLIVVMVIVKPWGGG